jgi:ssDNA-binding Zn-finger/Zn-ribbon topoisomerase 1
MIKCPACKKESNEYNWSMKTAAKFSIGAETCPTLIQVLLEWVKGNEETFDGFRLVCPRCNFGINFEDLPKPDGDAILRYAREVGQEYCEHWY